MSFFPSSPSRSFSKSTSVYICLLFLKRFGNIIVSIRIKMREMFLDLTFFLTKKKQSNYFCNIFMLEFQEKKFWFFFAFCYQAIIFDCCTIFQCNGWRYTMFEDLFFSLCFYREIERHWDLI